MASPETTELPALADVIVAYNQVTDRLKQSHDALCDEVRRLRAELEHKNRMLERKDRLAALGQMAAGMAHEIRNPLGGIQLYVSLLERDLAGQDDAVALVRRIFRATQRLNEIVGEMLGFAGLPAPDRGRVAVRGLVEGALAYACPRMDDAGFQMRVDVRAGLCIWADGHMIERVVLNLVLNALEAMPGGGCLSVSAEARADWVELTIADTGDGVDASVVDKVFDPFFTTKDHGTGLGLAIVHRIVEAHDGQIRLRSTPGEGTTVVVTLPAHETAGKVQPTVPQAGAA